MSNKRLLWHGDGSKFSGCGRVTHNNLRYLQIPYKVHLISWNSNCLSCGAIRPGNQTSYPITGIPKFPVGGINPETIIKRMLNEIATFNPEILIQYGDIFDFAYLQENGKNVYSEAIRQNFPNLNMVFYMTIDAEGNKPGINLDIYNKLIVSSYFGQKVIKEEYGKDSEVVYHGYDPDIYFNTSLQQKRDYRRKIGLTNEFVIMTMARNQFRKNLPATIRIFAEFAKGKNTKLLLFTALNAPHAVHNLNEIIKRNNIKDKIIVIDSGPHKPLRDEDINIYYNISDVYISTSYAEGFNLPVLESMVVGTPCIVSGYSAHKELVEDKGIVVPIKGYTIDQQKEYQIMDRKFGIVDEDKFVEELTRVYNDRNLLRVMGQKSQRFARDYIWVESAKRMYTILQGLK